MPVVGRRRFVFGLSFTRSDDPREEGTDDGTSMTNTTVRAPSYAPPPRPRSLLAHSSPDRGSSLGGGRRLAVSCRVIYVLGLLGAELVVCVVLIGCGVPVRICGNAVSCGRAA